MGLMLTLRPTMASVINSLAVLLTSEIVSLVLLSRLPTVSSTAEP